MAKYWQESPPILQEFLNYHASILSHSAKTVDEYFLDLRSFFRYLKVRRNPALSQTPFSEISILDVDLEFVSQTQLSEIYGFLTLSLPAALRLEKRNLLQERENVRPFDPSITISASMPIKWNRTPLSL